MPYVERDRSGAITGKFANRQPGIADEWVADDGVALEPSPSESKEMLCRQIDSAADAARRAVVGDPLRAIEYERAAEEAADFRAAGYPAAIVPRTVAAWAINGRTAREAADSILAEAASYTEALYLIREARLHAKQAVSTAIAAGDLGTAEQITSDSITEIARAASGVGNNAK